MADGAKGALGDRPRRDLVEVIEDLVRRGLPLERSGSGLLGALQRRVTSDDAKPPAARPRAIGTKAEAERHASELVKLDSVEAMIAYLNEHPQLALLFESIKQQDRITRARAGGKTRAAKLAAQQQAVKAAFEARSNPRESAAAFAERVTAAGCIGSQPITVSAETIRKVWLKGVARK